MTNWLIIKYLLLLHAPNWLTRIVNNNSRFISAFRPRAWTMPWHPRILTHKHIIFQLHSRISFSTSLCLRHFCLIKERCFMSIINVYLLGTVLLVLISNLTLVTDLVKHAWKVIHMLTLIILVWVYHFRFSIMLLLKWLLLITFSIALFLIMIVKLPFEPYLIILFGYLVNFLLCVPHLLLQIKIKNKFKFKIN